MSFLSMQEVRTVTFCCREALAKHGSAPLVRRTRRLSQRRSSPALPWEFLCAAPSSNNLLWSPARGELSNGNT